MYSTRSLPLPASRRPGGAVVLRIATIAVIASALSACGSDTPGTAASPAASTAAPPSAAPTDATTAAGPPDTAAAPAPTGAICDTVPSLETIGAIVGAAVTTVTDLSQPGSEKCEVTGADLALAIFERFDLETGAALLAVAETADFTDPALPGAVAWANGMMVEHNGAYWYATAITAATVGVMDAPEAYEASSALLRAWIGA